ncbi:hypothetical protein CGRA01v4_06531 [Colletotrichum graminicola]|nr:hypothetical protein CGRA01v4_06531 [Colletotrichum graminicola]
MVILGLLSTNVAGGHEAVGRLGLGVRMLLRRADRGPPVLQKHRGPRLPRRHRGYAMWFHFEPRPQSGPQAHLRGGEQAAGQAARGQVRGGDCGHAKGGRGAGVRGRDGQSQRK